MKVCSISPENTFMGINAIICGRLLKCTKVPNRGKMTERSLPQSASTPAAQ